METFTSQLRQVLRRLGRAPMFTAVTLVTLAIGIGANTTIFSVIEGVLLKSLPYPHPEQLVAVWLTAPGINIKDLNPSAATYFIFREQSHTFQDIGLYMGYSVNITGSGQPEHASGLLVTDGLLPVLGVKPLIGRSFTRADDSPGRTATVMLTYGYWQRKFSGSRSVIGKTIIVDGAVRQIVGVLPRDFRFGGADLALLLPMQLDRAKTSLMPFNYDSVARLKPGVTLPEANADVARMLPVVLRSFPLPPGFSLKMAEDVRMGPNLRTLKQDVVGDVGKVLWVLTGGIGLVLLIACVNMANLLLVRAEGRQQEFAIRAALGASQGRIAAEMLLESLVLALLASFLGLGLAHAALRGLIAIAPNDLPRLNEIGIDGTVVLFTLAVALFTSLLFGSIPVLKYAGRQLGTGLREGGRSMSESRERHRSRSVLVVVQVALALILLISSGLMIRTFRALTRVDPGFVGPSELQTFRVDIPDADVKDPEQVAHVEEELLHKIEAVPGISLVGLSMSVPMDGNEWGDAVFARDRTYSSGDIPLHRFRFVAPGYFKTLGTPFIAGRDVTWSEIYNKVPVAIVSEKLAREYWHNPSAALGKQIRANPKDNWREVVGVVGDVHDDGTDHDAPSSVYWPILVAHLEGNDIDVRRYVTFCIRSPRAGSETLMNEVRRAVWSVDPNLPLADVHTLDYLYRKSMARTSFALVMLAVAAGTALLLGVVGLYGVIAYSVSQRRREIGIRVALGAQHQQLTGMFIRDALTLTGLGVGCGLTAAPALTRLMSSLLFGVKPVDPATYAAVSLGLIATAALAGYLPARRAACVNPTESLRAE
jgi:predicted permease